MSVVDRIFRRSVEETIHPARRDEAESCLELGQFTLRIANYRHLRRAYGEDAALATVDQLVHRVGGILLDSCIAAPAEHGRIMVNMTGSPPFCGDGSARAWRIWLWSLCAALSSLPVEADSATVLPLLAGQWNRLPEGISSEGLEIANPWHMEDLAPDALLERDEAWAQRYRTDMDAAIGALASIGPCALHGQDRAGHVVLLLWQPVRDAREPDNVLYYEALLRFVDRHGVWVAPSSALLALERLGMISLLDHHVVSRVLTALEGDGEVRLGVNISAHSARRDPWWDDIQARLRAAPDVARRLTIEITETAALPDIASAVRFVEDMKRLGCKIALDDFGVGFASIRQVMALSPDIVKIDRLFLRRADVSSREGETFLRLVQLARSLGATVIAEGVETPAQAELAWRAGARWQQGYHWGRPAVSQTWRAPGRDIPSPESIAAMDFPSAPLAGSAG
jgi:EAL domain-containing protein (putative c-di-GMP-specific phosphodiesterase class I)